MKISLILESAYTPGYWRRFELIFKYLMNFNHNVSILSFYNGEREKIDLNGLVYIELSRLFQIISTLIFFVSFKKYSQFSYMVKTCLYLRTKKPDIILFHDFILGLFLIAFKALFLKETKLVYDWNDLRVRMMYYNKKKNVSFRFFKWIEEGLIPKYVDKIIVPTFFGKKYIIGKGVNPDKIFVLNEIIDMESFNDKKAQKNRIYTVNKKNNEKIVVWHGLIRDYHVEAISLIIEAVALARRKIPDLKVMIIGPFKVPGSKQKLNSLAQELNVKVEFMGRIPPSQIQSYLNKAHVGIQPLPYKMFTRFINGVKLSEYICSGLPVVCSDLEGPSELMRGNGFLFNPGDSKDLGDKIIKIFESDYSKLAANSNKIAKEEFSMEAINGKIKELEIFLNKN